MTIPSEERNSLIRARQFLVDLLDPKKTPRVPRIVRLEARARLRHYPAGHQIEEIYGKHFPER